MSLLSSLLDRIRPRRPSSAAGVDPAEERSAYETFLAGVYAPAGISAMSAEPAEALRVTAAQRAVSLIAGDIARSTIEVLGRGGDGAELLVGDPNRWQSQHAFRHAMQTRVLVDGNALAFIARDSFAAPVELQPLERGSVSLRTDRDADGLWRLVYRHQSLGDLSADDVFHLRAPSFDGLWGVAPLRLGSDSVRLARSLSAAGAAAFAHGTAAKVALVHPGPLKPSGQDALKAAYRAAHSGADKANEPLVLSEGIRIERISQSLEDSLFTDVADYSVQEVSRIFGVPTSLLSEHSRAAYGSLEALNRVYVFGCLAHWAACWAAEAKRKLLSPGSSISFDLDSIIRPTLGELVAATRGAIEAGIITRNEARDWLDLAPMPGLDVFAQALNLGTGGGASHLGRDTSAEVSALGDHS